MRIAAISGMMAILAVGGPAAAAPEVAALPGWMAGCWIDERADRWTEECWTTARAGSMLGAGRSGKGAALRNWEAMQILQSGDGVAFWAAPDGAGRTRFAMISSTASEVVFANPAHDYPQRIRYWREGDMLNAETALADGSKAMRWRYRRLG